MKKIVPFLVFIWLVIGIVSFAVWWKIVRNINTQSVLVAANEVAREMNIPWAIRFSQVKPSYGAEFKLILHNLEVVTSKGDVILTNKETEVRIPWVVFFKKSPVKVNILFRDIFIPSTDLLISEVDSFVDQQAPVQVVSSTLPSFLVDSIYNLRFLNTRGVYKGADYTIEKIFIINADPKKPTTFEVSFPWNRVVNGKTYSFSSKFLGEYRFSKQKIDIHFYSKNKMNIKDDFIDKNAELTFEGKGYYGSRLGFFTTLASKEDWLGFIGDLEWTKTNFRLNVPRFSIHHDFFFDLINLRALQSNSKNYTQNTVQGDLRFQKTVADQPVWDVNFQSKPNSKINLLDSEKKLLLASTTQARQKKFLIKLDEQEFLSLLVKEGSGKLNLSDKEFSILDPSKSWIKSIQEVLGFVDWMKWDSLAVSKSQMKWFNVDRRGDYLDISKLQVKELPLLNLRLDDKTITEWSATTVSQPIDEILELFEIEHFGIPGFRYNSSIYLKNDVLRFKTQWRGNILPILARSSCRSLIQEKQELSFLLTSDLTHTVEIERVGTETKVISWSSVSPGTKVIISGKWANDPISCSLKMSHQIGNKKPILHEIILN
jgi:hypothetical protein